MKRLAFIQIAPEYYVAIDRYCSDDGREDRQNLMLLSCAVWALDAGCEVQVSWDAGMDLDPSGFDAVFVVLFSVAGYRLQSVVSRFGAHGCAVIVCGPHAVSFPEHCHAVGAPATVGRCDKELFLTIVRDLDNRTLQRSYTTDRPAGEFPHQTRFRELGFLPKQAFMNVLSSTGCPHRCAFCTDAETRYFPTPSADVVENIARAEERLVVFNDPTFGVGAEGARLLSGLTALKGRNYVAFTTTALLRRAAFREMLPRAGFVLVEVGIENVNSPFSKNGGVDFLDLLPRCDFLILANYIWGYDPRDFDGSATNFLKELTRRAPNVLPMVFAPFSLPETSQHRQHCEEGRLFDPSYLCIGNEIPSMRLAGLDSPREYCRRLGNLSAELDEGRIARTRDWIDSNPRINRDSKALMQTMMDRHEATAGERASWAAAIAGAAPSEYRPFARDVVSNFAGDFDLGLS